MKINIISVGKVKEKYFKDSIDEYCKRVSKYTNFNRIEIPDEKIIASKNEIDIKNKEGEKIIKSLSLDSFNIAMTETGKQFTSEKFSEYIENLKNTGYQELNFIIGGALGLSENVIHKSNITISLSKMTLPHQMAYLFLVEQIYRGFKIINNEPYHK